MSRIIINGAAAPEGVILRPVVLQDGTILGYIPIKDHPLNSEIRRDLKISFSTFEDCYSFKSNFINVICANGGTSLRWPSDQYINVEGRYYENAEACINAGFEQDEDGYWERVDHSYNASSHSLERKMKTNSKYKVGFEVEKEDTNLYRRPYRKIYKDTGWVKEDDGSLGDGGFELVSPVFGLFSNIEKELEPVKDLINAKHSTRCGGHINISVDGKTSSEIIDDIRGWLPLLYALFESRTRSSYSAIMQTDRYKSSSGSKSHAITTKRGSIVEIRLFPAVRNVADILFRVRLLRYMLRNPLKKVQDFDNMLNRKFVRDLIINNNITLKQIQNHYSICA